MFFRFAAYHQAIAAGTPLTAPQIDALSALHPRTISEALEIYFATVPPGYPSYGIPAVFQPADIGSGNANLLTGINNAAATQRLDHAMYAYLVENTRAFEIFDRIMREYDAGERFETPDVATALWLRNTEALFFRDLPNGGALALTSWLRPDSRSIRRNTYYRLLGLDLNHGLEGNRAYPFDKPQAANRDFVLVFETFLREVWRGVMNATNTSGADETDDAAIADHVRRLREMLQVRRLNGNLHREEFLCVATMSWLHLTLAEDTAVVRALKAEAESAGDRLRKLGERVGIPAHARADNYFNMAFAISEVLTFIETDLNASNPAQAPAYYMLGGPNPQLAANMRTIITHWSLATGRDLKGLWVSSVAPALGRPVRGLPGASPAMPLLPARESQTVS